MRDNRRITFHTVGAKFTPNPYTINTIFMDSLGQTLYVIYGEYGNIPNSSITQEIYADSFEEALKIFKQENENETDWFNSFIELNGNWE